ncbi:MAG: endonuclease [Oscillospiraceae bacterium]|nr:endonuclease [Oscillospiraceae bacterium]
MKPTKLYNILYARYGNLDWWPADAPYEMMIGAILTQNTAWRNVEKAINNFGSDVTPKFVENATLDELVGIIRPAGFFNQKAAYLKCLTAWFKQYDYQAEKVAAQPLEILRHELLDIKGVGEETADSILLYGLELPSFVVDAYTKRLLGRLGVDVKLTYRDVQAWFMNSLPVDVPLYNNFHACIVYVCKDFCRAKAKCDGCPLGAICSSCQ